MQNLFTVMLVLIGAAVALFVGLVVLHLGATPTEETTGTETSTLIPQEIEGFTVEHIDRVDPIFEGELFSVHATFAPQESSPFKGSVENLGVTVCLLADAKAANEIKPLLLLGDATAVTVEGVRMQAFSNTDAKLAGLLWQDDLKLYYVLVSGVIDSENLDMNELNQAAQVAAQAILEGK